MVVFSGTHTSQAMGRGRLVSPHNSAVALGGADGGAFTMSGSWGKKKKYNYNLTT